MSQFWFTSDLHFGHANILTFCNRPWNDVAAMNQGLVDRWNDRVSDGDIVHVLGDLTWVGLTKIQPYLEQLKGNKILTPGNHDSVWKGHKKPSGKTALANAGFEVFDSEWKFFIQYPYVNPVLVSHFPYEGENGVRGERHQEHFPQDNGQWLLHGHVHQAWKVRGKQLNVGVDVHDWYPISEEDIIGIISGDPSSSS